MGEAGVFAPNVLIVDDEPQLLRLMARVLKREGHGVVEAADGRRAQEILRDPGDRLDAMILDVAIPPSGAGPVLQTALAERPGVGVVLISGDLLGDELRAELQVCGGVFLHKPFVPQTLISALRQSVDAEEDAAWHRS